MYGELHADGNLRAKATDRSGPSKTKKKTPKPNRMLLRSSAGAGGNVRRRLRNLILTAAV
jgi:hypothetical protein